MRILLTGYEPFGGESINPALESTKQLHGQMIAGAEVISIELPVSWEKALDKVVSAIDTYQPDAIISVGQAGGRAKITPEYIGINIMNGKDNYDVTKNEDKIAPDGPDGYFSNLPVKKMVESMQKAGIPAALSYTAGTYLCNYILYAVRHYVETNNLNIKSCFIHIPYLPEQAVNKPAIVASMSLEQIVAGLRCSIEAVVEAAQA